MRILIVDDSKAMRLIVTRTLRQAGFTGHDIIEAANGRDALDCCREQLPDLVLCDWNMPEMNGFDLLVSLRSSGFEVPFGFVTSESSAQLRQQAESAGAMFLISKPFTAEDFQEALDPVLA
jgi:two-component system chemotaxis response regulator CheY